MPHYQNIVVAIAETIRLTQEIDEVIERHGGWPDAFVTTTSQPSRSDDSRMAAAEVLELRPAPRLPLTDPVALAAAAEAEGPPDDQSVASENQGIASDREELDRAELICRIRRVFADGAGRDRQSVADALAGGVTKSDVADRLGEAIDAAVQRGVLADDSGILRLSARTIEQYERNHLKEQFLVALAERSWTERDEAIRRFARWMGFRRTGGAIGKTARSLINRLAREGRLERDGDLIRCPSRV